MCLLQLADLSLPMALCEPVTDMQRRGDFLEYVELLHEVSHKRLESQEWDSIECNHAGENLRASPLLHCQWAVSGESMHCTAQQCLGWGDIRCHFGG